MAIEVWGKSRRLGTLRSRMSAIIGQAGLTESAEILDVRRLPSKMQDRVFSIILRSESDGPRNLYTLNQMVEATVTYVKQMAAVGSQVRPQDILDEDTDLITRSLMTAQDMRHCDIKFVSQSAPTIIGTTAMIEQKYTLRCQIDLTSDRN